MSLKVLVALFAAFAMRCFRVDAAAKIDILRGDWKRLYGELSGL